MKCLQCSKKMGVIDTRIKDDGFRVERRRKCPSCGFRVTTNERVETKADEQRSLLMALKEEVVSFFKGIEERLK